MSSVPKRYRRTDRQKDRHISVALPLCARCALSGKSFIKSRQQVYVECNNNQLKQPLR